MHMHTKPLLVRAPQRMRFGIPAVCPLARALDGVHNERKDLQYIVVKTDDGRITEKKVEVLQRLREPE